MKCFSRAICAEGRDGSMTSPSQVLIRAIKVFFQRRGVPKARRVKRVTVPKVLAPVTGRSQRKSSTKTNWEERVKRRRRAVVLPGYSWALPCVPTLPTHLS